MTPKASQSTWAQTPERSNMLMLRVMTWISLHLGRRTARGVLHLIASYFLLFASDSRHASSSYLRRALGRPARWRDQYQHFFTFAATIHDRVYLVNQHFDLFDFEVHGEDMLHRVLADGNGVFLMGAHLGSFEVIRALGQKNMDLRVAILMHEENAQKINATLAAINPDSVQDIIGLGHIDSMLKVQARLNEGGVVGMLVDRTPGNDILHPVQILGSNAHLPLGPFPHGRFTTPSCGIHDWTLYGRQPLCHPFRSSGRFLCRCARRTRCSHAGGHHPLCRTARSILPQGPLQLV